MGAMSRRKGATGERELVNLAKAKGLAARRMAPMQAQYDSHETDVEIEGIYKVEVKRCQQLQLMKWMLQHEAAVEDGHPVLAFRRNGEKWRALVDLDLLLDLIADSVGQEIDHPSFESGQFDKGLAQADRELEDGETISLDALRMILQDRKRQAND